MICIKQHFSGLTKGKEYTTYGITKNGYVVRNDYGLLLAYSKDFLTQK